MFQTYLKWNHQIQAHCVRYICEKRLLNFIGKKPVLFPPLSSGWTKYLCLVGGLNAISTPDWLRNPAHDCPTLVHAHDSLFWENLKETLDNVSYQLQTITLCSLHDVKIGYTLHVVHWYFI